MQPNHQQQARGDAAVRARATLAGAFRLYQLDGREILISSRRARALLAILCLSGSEPIDRDTLRKLLWPGRYPAQAKASLRQCLLNLGKLLVPLGSDVLVTTRTSVALQPDVIMVELRDLSASEGLILADLDLGEPFAQWMEAKRLKLGHGSGQDEVLSRELPEAQLLPNRRGVAILPFRSGPAAGDQEYFADGMVDELITALNGVPGLQVAGRTSSFHYRSSALAPGQIAAQLGVSHLVEGSVQRQGERVRIHVHLIDGANGFELWGGRFDGILDNIFDLQEAVARGVTEALSGALGMVLQPPVVGNLTHSKEAYDLYLQGRALNARLFGEGVLTRAAELLEQAVALDPGFAEAWVLLGDVHQRMGIYVAGTDQTEASANMADCVRKAMAIKPNLGQAYGLLALHEFTRNNIVGSLDLAFEAIEVEPNNPAVAVRIGGLLLFCGLTRLGMPFLDRAIDQDPVDGRHYMVRSAGQLNLGDIDASIADAQRCVDLGFPSIWLGVALTAAGEHARAVEAYQQSRYAIANSIPPPSGTGPMPPAMIDAYWDVAARGVCSGKPEDREAYCRTLDFLHLSMQDKEHQAITLPAVFMGYSEMLFKTMGTRITLQNLACLMSIWTEIEPMRRIWQHEEFIPFAQRIGMVEAWEKYGWPDLLPMPTNRA
jgi:TolB-like protein